MLCPFLKRIKTLKLADYKHETKNVFPHLGIPSIFFLLAAKDCIPVFPAKN